ncbi:hypothetical protein [Rhodoferax bucti]|uniref:hypothetical protein n=1 Tax=Rhodoferax bucti TaxID=2576305 RepID=UPI00147780AB|nr:hypothetical protein [Rhodoferax bucti]
MTPPRLQSNSPTSDNPKFGRLLAVCGFAVLFCGMLVWLMADVFTDCCDLSWLGRIFR